MARVLAEQARRPSTGSLPAAASNSSMKVSVREGGVGVADRAPPEHRHAGLHGVQRDVPVRRWRRAGRSRLRREVGSMPSCIIASNGVPAMIDWPTMTWSQALIAPSAPIAALQPMHVDRPIIAAADVVLAHPDVLDRTLAAERLEDRRGFARVGRAGLRRAGRSCRRRAACAGEPALGSRPSVAGDRLLVDGLQLRCRYRRRWSRRRLSPAPNRAAPSARGRGRGRRTPPRASAPPRRRPASTSPSFGHVDAVRLRLLADTRR